MQKSNYAEQLAHENTQDQEITDRLQSMLACSLERQKDAEHEPELICTLSNSHKNKRRSA